MKRTPFLRKPKRRKRRAPLVPKALAQRQEAKAEAPIRDRDHLDRVKTQRCLKCGHPPPSDPSHPKELWPSTIGAKTGDDKVQPLCRRCHDDLGAHCRPEWWNGRADEARQWAATFYAETLRLRGLP